MKTKCLPTALLLLCFGCTPTEQPETVQELPEPDPGKAKNIVLLIGNGMGLAHIQAAMTVSHGNLQMSRATHSGFVTTHSPTAYVTGQGAAATALACGTWTFNNALGVDADTIPVSSFAELAAEYGLANGLVTTGDLTNPLSAAFVSHLATDDDRPEIALGFLRVPFAFLAGGGRKHFHLREDSRELLAELDESGYDVCFSLRDVEISAKPKLTAILAEEHLPGLSEERGKLFPDLVKNALIRLGKAEKGFFLVVIGDHIGRAATSGDPAAAIEETVDFDRAVGAALDFALLDKQTLVVVTANQEAGGMTLHGGSYENGTVTARFNTTGPSPIIVPVFAFGPGAGLFSGVLKNTDIHKNMLAAMGVEHTVQDY